MPYLDEHGEVWTLEELNEQAEIEREGAERERERQEDALRMDDIDPDEEWDGPDNEDLGLFPDGSRDDEPGDGYV